MSDPNGWVDPMGLCNCRLPDSQSFWNQYPNYWQPPAQVWSKVGGSLEAQYGEKGPNGVQNSCATRISYGLNKSGNLIPAGAPGANRNLNGDGQRYILSASQMKKYLKSKYGNPDKKLNGLFDYLLVQNSLQEGQVAIVSVQHHVGVIKKGYEDPHPDMLSSGGDVWILPFGGNCKCN